MKYQKEINFIRELYKKPEGFLPLHEPTFLGNEKKYVLETIESTFVSSVGEFVDRFEEILCEITGAKHAIAIVNGTNALHLALELAGVEQNDEVLTQALTFVATANAISCCGAITHFIDVDEDTLGLSPSKLKKHLKEIAEVKNGICYNKETNRRITACVPMHTFGLPTNIEELISVCNEYNIAVVEDAAESLGSFINNQHTGTFGLLGTFSFNGNKTITSGGGGAIITNNTALAQKAKHLSTQAKIAHQWEYKHDYIGYNYRMPNLNAALACAQLENLNQILENKRETALAYQKYFDGNKTITAIKEPQKTKANYWLNAILLKDRTERNLFLKETNKAGIMTRPIWELMNRLEMFKECPKSDLATSEWLVDRVVNIPSSFK